MTKPHTCPTCEGRRVQGLAGPPCPTCNGTGVVWEPPDGPVEAGVGAGGEDPLDLTGS
jgi:DnaJ-class molecular chaperone